MTIKASNPYSKEENPDSWIGWEDGFNSKPNQECPDSSYYGLEYTQAFYRGQGAQIVKNYEKEI